MNRRNPNGYYQKKRTFGKVRATTGMRTKRTTIHGPSGRPAATSAAEALAMASLGA